MLGRGGGCRRPKQLDGFEATTEGTAMPLARLRLRTGIPVLADSTEIWEGGGTPYLRPAYGHLHGDPAPAHGPPTPDAPPRTEVPIQGFLRGF